MRDQYHRNPKLEVIKHPAGQNPMSSCPIGCTCQACGGRKAVPKICDSCEAGHHEYCEEEGCKCNHPSYQGEMEEY